MLDNKGGDILKEEEHPKNEGNYDYIGFEGASYLNNESKIPLSKLSKLDVTLMFLNVCCSTYKVANAYINELLHFLQASYAISQLITHQ